MERMERSDCPIDTSMAIAVHRCLRALERASISVLAALGCT